MFNIEIGVPSSTSVVVVSGEDTLKEVFSRNNKGNLLTGNVTIKVYSAGKAARNITLGQVDSSINSLGIVADDLVVVSENLKSA